MTYNIIHKTIIITGLILLSVLLFGCSQAPEAAQAGGAAPVKVMTVAQTDAVTSKDYTAMLEGRVNIDIRPQVDGYLSQVFVDEGAYVSAGQPLFKINDMPYREELNKALGALHAAEAAMTNAQLEVDKLLPLVQNKVVSDVQLKAAQAAYKSAAANKELAEAVVASARINLDFTLIKAPVSGYIGRLPKKTGSLTGRSDAQALTTLSDVQEVYAYFSMAETDFIIFKAQYPGNTLQDKLKGLPQVDLVLADNSIYPVKGRIDMIDGQFDKHTGAITLRASFPNDKGLLRSGNTGKVRLSQSHEAALLVPQEATVELQDKIFVYALNDSNQVNKMPVSILGKSGTNYMVQDIKPGTRIVFSGLDRLQEGAVVNPTAVTVALSKK